MQTQPKIKPGIYEHYKGGKYRVHFVATHSETLENFVVYEALYDCRTFGKGSIWVRPLEMFQENITSIDGNKIPRFRFLE